MSNLQSGAAPIWGPIRRSLRVFVSYFQMGAKDLDPAAARNSVLANVLCFALGIVLLTIVVVNRLPQDTGAAFSPKPFTAAFAILLMAAPLFSKARPYFPISLYIFTVLFLTLLFSWFVGPQTAVYWALAPLPAFCLALLPRKHWWAAWIVLAAVISLVSLIVLSPFFGGIDDLPRELFLRARRVFFFATMAISVPAAIFAFFSVVNLDQQRLRLIDRSLPRHLHDALMKRRDRDSFTKLSDASLMVVQIAEFDKLTSQHSAIRVQEQLTEFQAFLTEAAAAHRVFLIKGVGPVFYLSDRLQPGHIRRPDGIMRLATYVQNHSGQDAVPKLQIGISLGPLNNGLIGTKKVLFDGWDVASEEADCLAKLAATGEVLFSNRFAQDLTTPINISKSSQIKIDGLGSLECHSISAPKAGDR